MEVLLLAREYEKRPDVKGAEYVAQQNLTGAGGSNADDSLRVAYGSANNPLRPGPEQDGITESQATTNFDAPVQELFAVVPDAQTFSEQRDNLGPEMPPRSGLLGKANSIEILATPASP